MAAAATFPAAASAAPTYAPNFDERTLVGGLKDTLGMAWAPDGRIFIIEKGGVLKVAQPGDSTASTLLDFRSQVNSAGDRGLLGVAVDKDFASNGYVYLLYTLELNPANPDVDTPMVSRLSRVTVNPDNTLANPSSPLTTILGSYELGPCPAPSNSVDCLPADINSHSIGTVRTDPRDGTLWVGNGDAATYGGVSDDAVRALNETSLAGKILHVDRNGKGLPGHKFCPSETDLSLVCTKVYAKGFRNPFRFDLRSDGALTVGDVGWNSREEIDVVKQGGKSYGWPCYEGAIRTPGYSERADCAGEYAKEGGPDAATPPDFDYGRADGGAVIAGPTYTGNVYPPAMQGDLFYGDYTARKLRRLAFDANGRPGTPVEVANNFDATDIEQTPDGRIAYASYGTGASGSGSIKVIDYTAGNSAPRVEMAASPTAGKLPLDVAFSSSGTYDPDGDALTYDWDFGDGSPRSSAANPTHTYAVAGNYTATLTVTDARGASASKSISIAAGGSAPTPVIDAPAAGALYRDGTSVSMSGSATDEQDGALPASAFEWTVRVFHRDHFHPIGTYSATKTATFNTLTDHDSDSNYEITLRVTDSSGLTGATTRTIDPQLSKLNIDSDPPGAPISYAGRALSAPFSTDAAVGFKTTVSTADSFRKDFKTYFFDNWSNGGDRVQNLTIPASDTSLTAAYAEDKAEGRNADSSSDQSSAFSADKALDRNPNTRWSSEFQDDQWWQVDLGNPRVVNRVVLNWETARAEVYDIQTSLDGVNFTTAARETISTEGETSTRFPAVSARYVRVKSVKRATQYGISLWEAYVLGPTDTGQPPDTSILSGPRYTVTGRDASFSFTSPASGATFECSLDGAPFAACDSPKSYSNLALGDHSFRVRAVAGGLTDPTPAQRDFYIAAGPDMARGQPATSSSDQDPTFGPAFAVDGRSDTRWSSTFADDQFWQVDLGSVQAIDRVEINWESAYAQSYRIMTSTDGTNFTQAAAETLSRAPGVRAVQFAARDARYVRFEGVKRATEWGFSFWDFKVFGPAPAPPDTAIDSGPANDSTIRTDSAGYGFSSATATSFECKLDGGDWASCSSPKTLTGLSEGSHTFSVRAVNAGGPDPTPASRSFTYLRPYSDTVMSTPGLVSYWRLGDPATATSATDSKGTATGVYRGGPTATPGLIAGDPNTARAFDGVDDYVDFNPVATGSPAQVSVEAWVKIAAKKTNKNYYHVLFTDGDIDFYKGITLAIDWNNQARFFVGKGYCCRGEAAATEAFTVGSVHQLVGTYDGTRVRLFVDGVEVASAPYTGGIAWSASRDMLIGKQFKGSFPTQRLTRGTLDEVAFYNQALSSSTVATHYRNGR